MQFDLEAVLDELGVENLKFGEKEITASCPMHPVILGRPDRHASWSINRETGAHNCFSCGWKGGLATLYRDLTGAVPEDVDMALQRATALAAIAPKAERQRQSAWDFPEWLGPVPDRLLDLRHIAPCSALAYDLRWDPQDKVWVMPIHDEFGEVVGAQYKQVGMVLTQPTGLVKGKYLFGLWAMRNQRQVALVESPLDAVRLHSAGIPAVASLGAWVTREQCRLLSRHFTTVILALDNDRVGREATNSVSERLTRLGCPTLQFDYTGLPGKDPGDVPDDDDLNHAWIRTLSFLR